MLLKSFFIVQFYNLKYGLSYDFLNHTTRRYRSTFDIKLQKFFIEIFYNLNKSLFATRARSNF